MIDFTRIVGFNWDEGNSQKSVDKHGVLPSQAEEVFFNQPLLIVADSKHSVDEARNLALGVTNERVFLAVIFTLRESHTLIRVISARRMSRKERAYYEKAE